MTYYAAVFTLALIVGIVIGFTVGAGWYWYSESEEVTRVKAAMYQLRCEMEEAGKPPRRLYLSVRGPAKNQMRMHEFNSIAAWKAEQVLSQVAHGLISFSESGTAGVLTRTEHLKFRNELLVLGYVRWKDPDAPAQGVEPTPELGRALLEHYRELPSPPPPLPGDHKNAGGRVRTGARGRTVTRARAKGRLLKGVGH
jgi:hypothetical protein